MCKSILLMALWLGTAAAQPTRREITNHSPREAQANDPKVPDVYAVDAGQFQRVLIFRFKYQADLLAGIQRMVEENHIKNAVILAGAGSVTGYQVHQVSNGTLPSRNVFVKDAAAPADVISMNGYIMNGKIHAHMTMATPDKAFGGHLEPETRVFTFAIVTVGVLADELDLSKLDVTDNR